MKSVLASILVGVVAFVGCGSESGDDGSNGGTSNGGIGFDDGKNGDGTSGGNGSNGGVGTVENVDPNSACASAHDGAVLAPISLVFMIDRSTSMERDGRQNTANLRWNPVKNGLSTFFNDPNSANVSASLAFFPVNNPGGGGGGDQNRTNCNVSAYQNAVVPMTQLPNGAAFSSAFDQGPDGFTPTVPALEGAIETAKAVKATGKNVAVVLATDGEPNSCPANLGNTAAYVNAVNEVAAKGLAAGIKTYVIGVGPSTGNLNSFAEKGGTGQAIMIPTNNAAQVSADLIKAIGQIASSLLGCNYGLPAPPAGQTLDVNKVNVNYTPAGGVATTLAYSHDCSNPNGWHYDDVNAPKEIILCNASCETAKAAVGAKLDIIFGCTTAVPPGGTDPNGNVK